MKLALVGCGKMGSLIEAVALRRGLAVVARYTREQPLGSAAADRAGLDGAEVGIDFTTAPAVPETVRAAAALGLPLVIGTTGWHDRLDEVRTAAEEGGIGLVYAANFSLGMNLFYRIVERAAELFAPVAAYDPFLEEAHHKAKRDSPSGTARELARRVGAAYGGREVPTVSLRAGYIPGTHAVGFDSAADTVVLEHRARSREGFAEGALLAARWLTGSAGRTGVYEFRRVIDDLMTNR